MSPEQIEDSTKVTASADIFALGCILYELVCGQRAYPKAFPSVWMDIIKGRYVSPRRLRPDLPESVINAIDGCLEVRPARRILDVCELRLVLAGELRWSRSSKTEEERTEEQEPVSQTLWHEGRTSLPDGEKMVAAAAIAMSPSHLPDESPNTEERSQPSLVGAPSPVDAGLQAQLDRARSVTRVAVVVAAILAGALLGTLLFLRNEIAPALDHTSGVGDHQ
jgi:serine/threonine protein kinase